MMPILIRAVRCRRGTSCPAAVDGFRGFHACDRAIGLDRGPRGKGNGTPREHWLAII